MIKKFLFLALIIFITTPNISQAKSKYFFGFGFSGMELNSSGSYNSPIYSNSETGNIETLYTPREVVGEETRDIDLSDALQWENNYQSLLNIHAGYQYSKSNILVLNFSFNIPKKVERNSSNSGSIFWKNSSSSSSSETEFSRFTYKHISLHNEHMLSNSIFTQLGLNISKFSSSSQYSFNPISSYDGKAIGLSTGFGYTKAISENKFFIGKILYSYQIHWNNNYGLDGMNMHINGFVFGLDFRHYLETK